MKKSSPIIILVPLLLVLVSHQCQSRPIERDTSDGLDSGIGGRSSNTSGQGWHVLWVSPVTCEPMYGFLPCSTNVWGLLFLIVVYQFLLSVGGQYVTTGSNLFFQIIGPGVFGASLFQVLSTVPQIILILVSALAGSDEEAQNRATSGMGLVAGGTVMLLTLVWGVSIVVGSYDLSSTTSTLNQDDHFTGNTSTGFGVVTDVETSYTARIILLSLIPFGFLLLAGLHRFFILLAFIIAMALFLASTLYQIFQPWIQNRRFEHLMNKYAKDKLLRLISRNGMPDARKIKELFDRIKRDDGSVSVIELKLLLLGVRMDDDDRTTERNVENIMTTFDTSGDGIISEDEFIKGMTKLVSDLSNQTSPHTNVHNNDNTSQALLANNTGTSTSKTQAPSKSWLTYLTASFYVILGTVILSVISDPLIGAVVNFSQAVHLSPFVVSYVAIPLALNYEPTVQSIVSARQKTRRSISLTLSSIYSGVFMNNVIGLMMFLAPVYGRNLIASAPTEILIVIIFSIGVNIFVCICTTFQRWVGYLVILLYPISILCIYFITSVLHWP